MNAAAGRLTSSIWMKEGRRTFVIRGQGEIARIQFTSLLGSDAEAEACGRKYSFSRGGFIHPRVIARLKGQTDDHAVLYLQPLGRSGIFVFGNGRRLAMEHAGRRGERRVVHSDGSEVLRLSDGSGLQSRGEIWFDPAWAGEESGLVAAMIIYSIVLAQEDTAAGAAAGV